MIRKYYDAARYRDLRELVDQAAAKHGDKVTFREFDPARKIIDHTCRQLQADVAALAAWLLNAGWKGSHFALIGESSYRYVVCYLAVVNWVGTIVPIDRELSVEETIKQVGLCDATAVFHSSPQAEKAGQVREGSPGVRLTVNISESDPTNALDAMIAEGRALLASGPALASEPLVDVNRCCSIIFTSGTTGANKGVMLCHRNITAVLHSALSMFKMADTYFSVLPINHTVEFNLFVLGSIASGFTICFNDGLKHIAENLTLFKPDMSMMVPMLVEHLYTNIWREAQRTRQAGKLRLGIAATRLLRLVGIDLRARIFAPILDKLGGNLRLIFCGGAPLSPRLVRGFDAFGISIYNGYGITECSPMVASNCPLSQVPGSVGTIAPDCQVRLGSVQPDGNGEIEVKGDNVMLGYYKDEAATRRSFTEDGWFRTGDIGRLDRSGSLYITGRVKNLIIVGNGKNVHPEELEELLASSVPYLQEAIVHAVRDRQGFERTIAVDAFLDPKFILEKGKEMALAQFKADVERVNRRLAKFKRITQVTLRDTEFEKTTTRKIKRGDRASRPV